MFDNVQNNMVVSNKDLIERLNIVEYNEKNPQEKYRRSFYIRSWRFTSENIRQIMNEFLIEDARSLVMESWFLQIGASYYYIRYVGFCVSSNPRERFEADLTNRKNVFMSNFFKKIEDLPVSLKPEIKIHVLKSNAITLSWAPNLQIESADIQEQILINVFGVDQLLNSQPGGLNAKYIPPLANFQEYVTTIKPGFFQLNIYPSKNNINHQFILGEIKYWIKTVIELQNRFDQTLSERSNRQIGKEKFKIRNGYANIKWLNLLVILMEMIQLPKKFKHCKASYNNYFFKKVLLLHHFQNFLLRMVLIAKRT